MIYILCGNCKSEILTDTVYSIEESDYTLYGKPTNLKIISYPMKCKNCGYLSYNIEEPSDLKTRKVITLKSYQDIIQTDMYDFLILSTLTTDKYKKFEYLLTQYYLTETKDILYLVMDSWQRCDIHKMDFDFIIYYLDLLRLNSYFDEANEILLYIKKHLWFLLFFKNRRMLYKIIKTEQYLISLHNTNSYMVSDISK